MNAALRQQRKYFIADYISINIGWLLFNVVRYHFFTGYNYIYTLWQYLSSPTLIIEQFCVPLAVLAIYAVSGSYRKHDILFRSRMDELLNTALVSMLVCVGVLITLLLDDTVRQRFVNFRVLWMLLVCMFLPVAIVRYAISTATSHLIHRGQLRRRTLAIGAVEERSNALERIVSDCKNVFEVVDSIDINNNATSGLPDISRICEDRKIDSVLYLPAENTSISPELLGELFRLNRPVLVPAHLLDLSIFQPKAWNVAAEPLVDITDPNVAPYIANTKRLADIVVSAVALAVIWPVMLAIAAAVKLSSPGPAIFRQERIGRFKKPFTILKFRSMTVDAEPDGKPRLSHGNADKRITRVGRFLRKYRLDELPQFWNVLVGDMSLVGPRPERPYFVDRLAERVHWHGIIHRVRPGLTSWGMVKFGYADTIDQMVDRARYDLLYIRSVSLAVDLKILFHTIVTVLTGRGR